MELKVEKNVLLNDISFTCWKSKVLSFLNANYNFLCPDFGRVIIYIVDHQQMSDLHGKFFKDPSTTDVITFTYRNEEMVEAEIFVNYEFARDFSKENCLSVEDELFRYVIHGILHALGYDDQTEEERFIMKEKEDEWVKLFQMFHVKH